MFDPVKHFINLNERLVFMMSRSRFLTGLNGLREVHFFQLLRKLVPTAPDIGAW